MARLMPELEAFFHYRNLDVSSIKELAKRWNPKVERDPLCRFWVVKILGRFESGTAKPEVVQTAASLIEEGYEVFVVSDATASRTLESEQACIARLSACGAGIVTTEMVVFEWLGKAGTADFKALLPLIK